ncbi:hypothetical protein [Saccharomonospora xinjiangensis]|uniref:Uncharacterized protein n=1 Tax=Saccharomonospora xinjiangensis XJ-54 TaxID=882086 RepID=I0UWS4_9PSEU|nr:hypothetical protein [Saccharomonospora xinjiangensis]EID52327.1 hypothetical protein SacxiDRAFT_0038 [Saccharomonospora xinjiangensis XJ-54]
MANDDSSFDGDPAPPGQVTVVNTTNALGEVVTTAVITAAVLPFVQTLAKKAAEDSYNAVRDWLRRQFGDAAADSADGSRALLVVKDPDPKLDLAVYVGPAMSNEAIRALEDLDLGQISDKAKRGKNASTQIYWDAAAQCWRVVHKRRRTR